MIPHLQEGQKDSATGNPVVARIASNTQGRDFVMGDIHGSLPAVEEFLREVKFDTSTDRLICVGDLTNRGPESLRCLQLLEEPWFHGVLGNHDENTIRALTHHLQVPRKKLYDWGPWEFLAKNGGLWLAKEACHPKNTKALTIAIQNLRQLPRLLVIGEDKNRYHVVHAAAVKRMDGNPRLLSNDRIDLALSGEKPLKNFEQLNEYRGIANLAEENEKENPALNETFQSAEGLSLTHCGHTPMKKPLKVLSHFHIDTGAGKPDEKNNIRWLTVTEPLAPNQPVLQFRAGHPQLKIKTKEIVKTAIKTAKSTGLEFER